MKTALVMEGGAMRGMFTCGVIDTFMRHGVTFDGAAGVSAGAVFGCNFKSRQVGRPLRYNMRYCRDPRYCSLRSLLRTGDLYGADFCYRELPDELDVFDRAAFRENPLAFYVGATDVRTGQCVYHLCGDGGERDMRWFQASASMPLVSRPVAVDGLLLLDGGITDAVPYAVMDREGYDRQVVVLTQPAGYRKRPAAGLPVIRFLLRRYPKAAEAMAERHRMYNRQMDELDRREADGRALVLRPPEPLAIGHTEKRPGELERVYHIGVREAERRIREIQAFLTVGLASPLRDPPDGVSCRAFGPPGRKRRKVEIADAISSSHRTCRCCGLYARVCPLALPSARPLRHSHPIAFQVRPAASSAG